jgi:medium-chain acyl-[acyl-carrier-protein] hydrolase
VTAAPSGSATAPPANPGADARARAGADPWFLRVAPAVVDGFPVFCLPHAGGSATAYRPWIIPAARTDPRLRIIPVQPPGRDGRFREEPLRRMDAFIGQLADALLRHEAIADGEPFAVFGHSMGALAAYELTAVLTERGRAPRHLFVSGMPAPHLPRELPDLHRAGDDEVRERLALLNGPRAQAFVHSALFDLLLPLIRADFEVCETYRAPDRSPLPVPVTAFGGAHDPRVAPDGIRQWHSRTCGPFRCRIFPGGHFYLTDHVEELLAEIARGLGTDARGVSA